MKKKIFLLIAGCIFTVAALACIQGYFIYNTYLLRAKEANAAITSQFLDLETRDQLDTLNNVWMTKTQDFIERYWHKQADRAEYPYFIKEMQDSLSQAACQTLTKERFFEGYDVSYSNYVVGVIVFDLEAKTSDTIFKGKLLIYGTNTEGMPETQASQSVWNDGDRIRGEYMYEIATRRFYSISNWKEAILMKMGGLLVFSVVLLIFVVLLFYLSIKSLIAQRKIADIKTDFINNITHEFQTPLAALDIAVKTLQRKESELSPENYKNTLNIIGRQNQRMQKLFSRVTEASLAPDITSSTLEILGCSDILEIINDFSLSHPDTSISCDTSKDITMKMDRFHLNTILLNLLDNAVKYGATAVHISLEEATGEVMLIVKDNGPGIPEKEQQVIFEKFYRVQKGNIHTTKGLGLGLYYVRSVIDAYKGSITVKSELGKGSEFIISIPSA